MNKQIINFTANEQDLKRIGGECHYSSNKVSYVEAHFALGENWSGFDSVRAVWFTDFIAGVTTVLDSEGVCIVPTEVLKNRCKVNVNLVGSIVEDDVISDRLTSYPVVALVVDARARVDGSLPAEATPSQVEQFAAAVREDADRAEAAKDEARGYAADAETSAQNASTSEANAEGYAGDAMVSAQNALASEQSASASAQSAAESAQSAAENADRAEQAAADAGFMFFHIDGNGYLIMEHTQSVDNIDFSLVNGNLILEVA